MWGAVDLPVSIPLERWDVDHGTGAPPEIIQTNMLRFAALADGIDAFGAAAFRIAPAEAAAIDPQQRILLEQAHCALQVLFAFLATVFALALCLLLGCCFQCCVCFLFFTEAGYQQLTRDGVDFPTTERRMTSFQRSASKVMRVPTHLGFTMHQAAVSDKVRQQGAQMQDASILGTHDQIKDKF